MKQKEWLAVFDFDKTLSTNDREVLKKTILELHRAKQMGAKIVICSARTLDYLVRIADELIGHDIVDFVSGCNGAFGYDMKKRDFAWKETISREQTNRLIEATETIGLIPEAMSMHREIVDKRLGDGRKDEPLHKRLGIEYCIVDDIEVELNELYDKGEEIVLLATVGDIEQDITSLVETIKEQFSDLEFIKPCDEGEMGYVDIVQKGVSKGAAVRRMQEMYRIPKECTAVFGDAPNDEAMFEEAGIRIALKNGKPELKEKATFITDRDNNNNGVAQGIVGTIVSMRKDLVVRNPRLRQKGERKTPDYEKQVREEQR